jgi:8-oxo-dGTP pyrophosphatase MutT (NUDIX family)
VSAGVGRARAHGDWPRSLAAEVGAALDSHRAADAREEAATTWILAALARLAHPFDETAGREHVTASGIVVGGPGTVLHLHKRLGRWLQPGGHVERAETPWDAARRETEEETGLAVAHPVGGPRLIHVDVHRGARGHTHLDLRYLLVSSDHRDPRPPEGESALARWFDWDWALAHADDALVGALRAARRQPEARRAPLAGDADSHRPAQGAVGCGAVSRHNGDAQT